MRRHDKNRHIEKVNILLQEHHGGEFPTKILDKSVKVFLDELKMKDEKAYNSVESVIEKYFD